MLKLFGAKARLLAGFALAGALGNPALAQVAPNTTPTGETVISGSAGFDRPGAGQLDITQNSNRVVIEWDNFDIGSAAQTEFIQPGAGAVAVNRITGGGADPTQILGNLTANGQVVILDPNGVIFGSGSTIDVGGLVASTGDINDTDFMAGGGALDLTGIDTGGEVINNGDITAADGGLVALVAPHAANNGTITARLGRVVMAAGDKVTVDFFGDELITIQPGDSIQDALVENSGAIFADGGSVRMSVQAAQGVLSDAVNMDGIIRADRVGTQNGTIVLDGGVRGITDVSGDITASEGDVTLAARQGVSLTGTVDTRNGGALGTLTIEQQNVNIGSDASGAGTVNGGDLAELLANNDVTFHSTGNITLTDDVNVSRDSGGGVTDGDLTITGLGGRFYIDNDLQVGNGDVAVSTNAAYLVGGLYDASGGLLGASRISGDVGLAAVMSTSASIQQAIEMTGVGRTTWLSMGTYDQNVTINKSMMLQGQNSGGNTPTIRGTVNNGTVVTVAADDVRIDQVTISSDIRGTSDESRYGVSASGVTGLEVYNSTFAGFDQNADVAINLSNADGAEIVSNAFKGARRAIRARNSDGMIAIGNEIGGSYIAIDVDNMNNGIIRGNAIDSTTAAVYVTDSDDMEISHNVISDSTYGVYVINLDNSEIRWNRITGNGYVGMYLYNVDDSLVENNAISSSTHGIYIDEADRLTVTGNLICDGCEPGGSETGRSDFGITMWDSNQVDFINNHIENMDDYALGYSNSGNLLFDSNGLYNSGTVGLVGASGSNGNTTLRDNIFQDNAIGAWFQSGTLFFDGVNHFIGGNIGLRLDTRNVRIRGNTLGTTSFTGQNTYYIQLMNDAMDNRNIDASQSSFDGVVAEDMDDSEKALVENRIYDEDDDRDVGDINLD